jgi:hypothetical protein
LRLDKKDIVKVVEPLVIDRVALLEAFLEEGVDIRLKGRS